MAPLAQKEMIIASTVDDIVFTDEISGIGASFLKQTIAKFTRPESGAIRFDVAEEISPRVWRDYWSAGQGVGTISKIVPARKICEQLAAEYLDGLKRATCCGGASAVERFAAE